MTVDARTRWNRDVRALAPDEVFESVLPDAFVRHGALAVRGAAVRHAAPLGLVVDGREVTLDLGGPAPVLHPGIERAGVVAELGAAALSDLVQDWQSTMGLAMTARVRLTRGGMDEWISWEPILRALLDGRKVHESGDVDFVDADGRPLDLDRTFRMDEDDPAEMRHFLEQAGFLHVRDVFTEAEMATVADDIDHWIAKATPDDGESWWAVDDRGVSQAVRVLFFLEKSDALRELVHDPRYLAIGALGGDGHVHKGSAEGLVKPLGIVRGLSDLPWHKDCGQGKHAYICNGLTCGISVTGADRTSGALGVIPGSHRANTLATGRDPLLDLAARMLETRTGDVTVHCSDTLHRAHPPVERPRKVVYSSYSLPPRPGDVVPDDPRYGRRARAELTDVQDRIDAAAGSR